MFAWVIGQGGVVIISLITLFAGVTDALVYDVLVLCTCGFFLLVVVCFTLFILDFPVIVVALYHLVLLFTINLDFELDTW